MGNLFLRYFRFLLNFFAISIIGKVFVFGETIDQSKAVQLLIISTIFVICYYLFFSDKKKD
jgi:uncharacterized membrane protein